MDEEWAWWERTDEQESLRPSPTESRLGEDENTCFRRPSCSPSLLAGCSRAVNDENQSGSTFGVSSADSMEQELRNSEDRCNDLDGGVRLLFNSETNTTIAVVSTSSHQENANKVEPIIHSYFQSCVADGSARQISEFTYELPFGCVREHQTRLRRIDGVPPKLVHASLNALQDSDEAYPYKKQYTMKSPTPSTTATTHVPPFPLLEEVLEIVRLHRLGEDLDLFSVYCMMRTNHVALHKIGRRMAIRRLQNAELYMTPYTDGCGLSGCSMFSRKGDTTKTTIHHEYGRPVEYERCDDIPLVVVDEESSVVNNDSDPRQYIRRTFRPSTDSASAHFEWSCGELVFSNLTRIVGDIGIREYVGQKLCLWWNPSLVDRKAIEKPEKAIKLGEIHLDPMLKRGVEEFEMRRSQVFLHVVGSNTVQTDPVTEQYSGCIRVLELRIEVEALVRSVSHFLEPLLQARYTKAEETRPLLAQEVAYLQEVQKATHL